MYHYFGVLREAVLVFLKQHPKKSTASAKTVKRLFQRLSHVGTTTPVSQT